MEELQLDHEPSQNHWAKLIADDDIATGYHTSWDHAYEAAWMSLDAEYNYNYEYRESWWNAQRNILLSRICGGLVLCI